MRTKPVIVSVPTGRTAESQVEELFEVSFETDQVGWGNNGMGGWMDGGQCGGIALPAVAVARVDSAEDGVDRAMALGLQRRSGHRALNREVY